MKTEILKICTPDDTQAVQKVAKLLDAGSLVAFPTETVYGIGCKADKHTLDRLNEVKGRQPDKHYTLHIGSPEQLEKYIPSMGSKARKLIQNAFPGPVTIVFELDDTVLNQVKKDLSESVFDLLYADRTLGVRYPACPVTCAILAAAESPIVAPSANPAGLAPATSAKEVLAYFDGKIESIVEIPGFELDFKKSSTVAKIGRRDIQILREGAMSALQIREWATIQLLFVCTGNTCRSPMAEGFCRKYFADNLGCSVDDLENFGYIINSAGVAACEAMPASRYAVEVCRDSKIDLSNHQSLQLTPEDIEQSDMIFTMSQYHRDCVVQSFPLASEKCFMLDETGDILDPIGSGIEVYQNCFRQISNSIIKEGNHFMKVAVANDHRGHAAIEQIKAIVSQLGLECIDCSTPGDQPVDYPDTAYVAANTVAEKKADRAILVCGTGIGMSMAANKVKGIRAALCYDELAAKLSREHNDANVLCLSGDLIGPMMVRKIVETWLTTDFVAGRHLRRVKKIEAIEKGDDPREITTSQ